MGKTGKSMFLLLAYSMLLSACGGKSGSTDNAEQSALPKQTQKDVAVSVLTDVNVEHSIDKGLGANDCSTYEAMEKQSDIIVYGKKTKEYFKEPEYEGDWYDLMAEIEVQTLVKQGQKSFRSGDKITIREDISYSSEYNLVSHVNGYQKMEVGKEYYLMLGKIDEDSNQYYIIGGIYGRIPKDKSEAVVFESDECKLSAKDKKRTDKWIGRNRMELERSKGGDW